MPRPEPTALSARLRCGACAPAFDLRDATGARASSPRGVPWVLAFTPASPFAADRATRAVDPDLGVPLDALDAVVIVVADDGITCVRPDGVTRLVEPGPELARERAALADAYGLAADAIAVFVIDADGVIRFARPRARHLATVLPRALASAGQAVTRGATVTTLSRAEAAVTSLVTSFALALRPASQAGVTQPIDLAAVPAPRRPAPETV